MIKALLARIKEGCRTGTFPPAAPSLPPEFRGRPEIDADASEEDVKKMKAVCPVEDALNFSDGVATIDMGRCIFCGRCAEASSKIRFTKEYRLGVFNREDLIASKRLWLESDGAVFKFTAAPRIGIAYASKRDQSRKWRFTLRNKQLASSRNPGN